MTNTSPAVQQGVRSRILTLVWTALTLALLVLGLGVWTVSEVSSLRDHESKLFQAQIFLSTFAQETKFLGLVATRTLLSPDQSKTISERIGESLKSFEDLERFFQGNKQKLLELGSDLGKLEDTKQFVSQTEGLLINVRNTIQSVREKNALDYAEISLGGDWEKLQQFTEQILRGLSSHTAQRREEASELLQRKSVALAYFNLAAVALFLVTLLVLGITIASNIHRDTALSSEKVTQTFASIGHTLHDLSQAGHALASATAAHDTKISDTLDSLRHTQTILSRICEESLISESYAYETCQRLDEGTAVLKDASQAVATAKETRLVLDDLVRVLDNIKAKMSEMHHAASRTQMLSYNASIEAARAGDYGRGFAVVALELSRIADMGTKATDEMTKALSGSTNSVAESKHRFAAIVDNLGTSFTHAEEHVERMSKAAQGAHLKLSGVKNDLLDHARKLGGCLAAMSSVQSTAKTKEDMVRGLAGLSDILNHQASELSSTFDRVRMLLHGSDIATQTNLGKPRATVKRNLPESSATPESAMSETLAVSISSGTDSSPAAVSQDESSAGKGQVITAKDRDTPNTDDTMRKSA